MGMAASLQGGGISDNGLSYLANPVSSVMIALIAPG